MKRGEDPDATPEILKQQQEIIDSCDICQRIAKEPGQIDFLFLFYILSKETMLHVFFQGTKTHDTRANVG